MASSSWNRKSADAFALMHCSLRGIPLRARPEELLRERVVQELLVLGYPRAYLAIEVPLQALDRIACQKQHDTAVEIPNRRVDLVAYTQNPCKHTGGLLPLLLIECKAGAFTTRGWRQLLGYQHHVGAPFIAMITKTAYYFHALPALTAQTGIPQDMRSEKLGQPIRLDKLPSFNSLAALLA